jgi:hypothetical protein
MGRALHRCLRCDPAMDTPLFLRVFALLLLLGGTGCASVTGQGFLFSVGVTSEKYVNVADAEHSVFLSEEGSERIVGALAVGCVCQHAECEPGGL